MLTIRQAVERRQAFVPIVGAILVETAIEAMFLSLLATGVKSIFRLVTRKTAQRIAKKVVVEGGKKATLRLSKTMLKKAVKEAGEAAIVSMAIQKGKILTEHGKGILSKKREEQEKAARAIHEHLGTSPEKRDPVEIEETKKPRAEHGAKPPRGYKKMKRSKRGGYKKVTTDGNVLYWYPPGQ